MVNLNLIRAEGRIMKRFKKLAACVLVAGLALGPCYFVIAAEPIPAPSAPREAKPEKPFTNHKAFHPRLLEIAREYETYGRVDDEYRWAPWLCRKPQASAA